MGAVTDDAISQLDQIRIVLVSLLVLLPSMKLKSYQYTIFGFIIPEKIYEKRVQ